MAVDMGNYRNVGGSYDENDNTVIVRHRHSKSQPSHGFEVRTRIVKVVSCEARENVVLAWSLKDSYVTRSVNSPTVTLKKLRQHKSSLTLIFHSTDQTPDEKWLHETSTKDSHMDCTTKALNLQGKERLLSSDVKRCRMAVE
ncbi:hypothetical protein Bbelb_207810 [Branchiostoma belcheri]|nr:hypothetical protein Bbelb_207810 [Branchiostoma belcheri]